jgi:hypothetical protein
MRTTVNVFVCGIAAYAFALCPLAAAEEPPPREPGWIPSFAIHGGAAMQDMESTVDSFCQNGGPGSESQRLASCDFLVAPGPAPLRPAASGADLTVSPFVGFELQLMMPAIDVIPGRPRVFVAGEIRLTFPPTKKLALEGSPTGVAANLDLERLPTVALSGVGSQTASEVDTLGWGAGLGVAFPFHFRGHQLWLKPSARWTNYTVNVYGKVVVGLKDDPPFGNTFGANLREINLLADDTINVNGVGPGFELELDAGQFGPIGVAVFAGGAIYKIFGDRSVAFSQTLSLTGDGLPPDTYTANFTHEIDPWMYRAGVGIRFNWLGR